MSVATSQTETRPVPEFFVDGDLDLRDDENDAITLVASSERALPVQNVRLADNLRELILRGSYNFKSRAVVCTSEVDHEVVSEREQTVYLHLPTGLTKLSVFGVVSLLGVSGDVITSVTSLTLAWLAEMPRISEFCPMLRELIIANSGWRGPSSNAEIYLPHLERLDIATLRASVTFRVPALRDLIISDVDIEEVLNYRDFAPTVTTLHLDRIVSMPEAEWDSLESLSVVPTPHTGATVIPRIPWLTTLTTTSPVTTNGKLVSNIEEYREAWALIGKKGAGSCR